MHSLIAAVLARLRGAPHRQAFRYDSRHGMTCQYSAMEKERNNMSMKLKVAFALASATLALGGASAVRADVTLLPDTPNITNVGSLYDFNYFISNTGGTPVNLDQSGFTLSDPSWLYVDFLTGGTNASTADLASDFGLTPDDLDPSNSANLLITPTTLNPGDGVDGQPLFELFLPGGKTLADGTASYFVYDSSVTDANGAPIVQGTVTVGGTAVPEPGTWAMLVSGSLGGLMLMRRRRK
jgi:hypothetical protein